MFERFDIERSDTVSGIAGRNHRITSLLLEVRKHTDEGSIVVGTIAAHTKTGQSVVSVVIIVKREPQLLEVVGALHTASRFTRRLNSGEKQTNKNTDNSDNNEEFDEGKAATSSTIKETRIHKRLHFKRNEKNKNWGRGALQRNRNVKRRVSNGTTRATRRKIRP